MGVKAQTPAATPENLVLGAGAIYFNYGEVSEAVIGATRGGSTFTVEREIREVEQDGALGPIMGLRQKTRIVPILKVNAMELTTTTLPKFYAGMTVTTSNPNYDVVTEDSDIVAGDYLTNVAFVGENLAGEDVVIIIKNALGDGALEAAAEHKNELVPEVQFTGHYASSALTTVPYEIRFPKATPDTTAPTVTVVPADASTGIAVTADIVWTFSEAIRLDCITENNFFLMKSDGTAVAGALTYNAAQTIITFNPTASMSGSTAHIAIATTNVVDVKGNHLAAQSVTNFTTA